MLGVMSFPELADVVSDDPNAKAAILHAEDETPGRVAIIMGDERLLQERMRETFPKVLYAATKQALKTPETAACAIFMGQILKTWSDVHGAIDARASQEFPHVSFHIMHVLLGGENQRMIHFTSNVLT